MKCEKTFLSWRRARAFAHRNSTSATATIRAAWDIPTVRRTATGALFVIGMGTSYLLYRDYQQAGSLSNFAQDLLPPKSDLLSLSGAKQIAWSAFKLVMAVDEPAVISAGAIGSYMLWRRSQGSKALPAWSLMLRLAAVSIAGTVSGSNPVQPMDLRRPGPVAMQAAAVAPMLDRMLTPRYAALSRT